MDWDSIEDLVAEFGISRDVTDVAGIRQELIALLKDYHPDKTGGEFASSHQEFMFFKVAEAISYIGRPQVSALPAIRGRRASPLVEIGAESNRSAPDLIHAGDARVLEEYRQSNKRYYALPKITSNFLFAICSVLLALLGQIKDNPFYQDLRSRVAVSAEENMKRALYMRLQYLEASSCYLGRAAAIPLSSERAVNQELSGMQQAVDLYRLGGEDEEVLFRKYGEVLAAPCGTTGRLGLDSWKEVPELVMYQLEETTSIAHSVKEAKSMPYSARILAGRLQGRAEIYAQAAKDIPLRANSYADRLISSYIAWGWVIAFVCFLLVRLRERSDEQWAEYLSTDDGLAYVLMRIVEEQSVMGKNSFLLGSAEFSQIVGVKPAPSALRFVLGKNIDSSRIDSVARLLLSKLVERGVLSRIDRRDVQAWYSLSDEVVERYREMVHTASRRSARWDLKLRWRK